MTQKADSSIEYFFAHALALELEASERLYDVAEMMEVHNNKALAELFYELSRESSLHAKSIEKQSSHLELPHLKPWEFHWPGNESPETLDTHELHYLLTPHQALDVVLECERRAMAYYQSVASETEIHAIEVLAHAMADEEKEHVNLLLARKKALGPPALDHRIDLDPPHMPE